MVTTFISPTDVSTVASASRPRSRFKARQAQFRRSRPSRLLRSLPRPKMQRETLAWGTAAVLGGTMLLWNWKLFIATGTGMSATLGVYLLLQSKWRLRWGHLHRWFSGPQKPVVLATTTGGLATLSTYMATAIWVSSDNHWMASGFILEGLATLAILGLLTWQTLHRVLGRDHVDLNGMLSQLSQEDPLKQVVALRQLERWILAELVDEQEQQTILDCCRVLLTRDLDAVVREAALALLASQSTQDALSLVSDKGGLNLRVARRTAKRH
ncbi:MAG: hypothetical protein JJU32_12950 [Phormidium sp. BM_Day4_Bin.17]|nr:hypothetical protein [Phormidium sp. BM_Day4_Bin.17]UCJ10435.1 MAG: hypothetical protein JWS08_11225 [Phormidium sp. PBR-2020]